MSPRLRFRYPSVVSRGFTLIEAMIAMAFLAVGLLGTFMGLVHAANMAREGQLRQYKMELIDAKLNRLMLADKIAMANMVGGLQTISNTLMPPTVAIGGSPWVIDPSAPDLRTYSDGTQILPGDLGVGAVFDVKPDGEIRRNPATFLNCADPAIPVGSYCREVLLHNRLPLPTSAPNTLIQGNLDGVGSSSFTLWIRVSRKGEDPELAVVERKVVVL
jgi:prepilin-type N-terminal cleavage/methylation domain-containing protein